MAFIRMDLYSRCLLRTVSVTAVVPVDKAKHPGDSIREKDRPYKTLYLLNGLYGNDSDWFLETSIAPLARALDLAVVMPSGENHFYTDCAATGEEYGRFIGKELVDRTRALFPLSEKREDTFIAGLSMGGYGAMRNGLRYAETFGYAAALSGAFIADRVMDPGLDDSDPEFARRRRFYQAILGDPAKFRGSDNDYEALYLRLKAEKRPEPRLYMACGTEDSLIGANRHFRDFLLEHGADLTYEEGPGRHKFTFWGEYIKHVLNWLPLERKIDEKLLEEIY